MKSKKEVKDCYKEMKFKIGVFQIRNMVNNKITSVQNVLKEQIDAHVYWCKHVQNYQFYN